MHNFHAFAFVDEFHRQQLLLEAQNDGLADAARTYQQQARLEDHARFRVLRDVPLAVRNWFATPRAAVRRELASRVQH